MTKNDAYVNVNDVSENEILLGTTHSLVTPYLQSFT
jgi:hypothetical protein